MKNVLKIMDKDHEQLENLFNRILSSLSGDYEKTDILFSEFKTVLQKHFQWEENILFPLFEERSGRAGEDTTFVLKNEHNQIQNMFIEKIEKLITGKRFDEMKPMIVGLEEMLLMHRKMETDIFYPWFDVSLDIEEKKNVIKKLKEIRKNE
jgi:iron-sulfur cluster repair protein YtfE (RIC family)